MCVSVCAYIRLGLLEDEERQGEVSLGQADQVLSEQSFGGALFLSLAAVQERHRPLEGVLHVALWAGLGVGVGMRVGGGGRRRRRWRQDCGL